MGQGFSIIRALARLNAMGALTGSAVLMLITCVSSPVFPSINFSTTHFDDGGELDLGMWGYCYTSGSGQKTCSKTSVGYNLNLAQLPGYSANQGTANVNVVNKPLSTAMIFAPLAVGATLLALLFSLIPIRIVTFLAIGTVFLAIGADAIVFTIEIATFTQANGRIGLLFTPNTAVHPQLGRCLWYTLGSLVATVGAFLFLLIALPPKTVSPKHPTAYRDMVSNERNHGTDYSRRYSVEKAGRAGHRNGYGDAGGVDRRSSRRSGYGSDYVAASHPRRSASRTSRRSDGGRSGRLKAQLESDEEDVGRSSRRSRRREPDSEEELSDGY